MNTDVQAFYKFLLARSDLQAQLQAAESTQALIALAVQMGANNGFAVTAAEVSSLVESEVDGELADEQLEQISGGGWDWSGCDACE
ncbi:MAG: Nif11 family protein [Chloroflexota bacterium]